MTYTATQPDTAKISRRIAAYAAGLRFEDLPAATVDKTKQAVLDLIGIAVRSTIEGESTQTVLRVVDGLGGAGSTTAWGIGARYAPHYAALLNGTLAHTLDFDDTHEGGSIHPGTTVIPAALAIGEERGASGRRLIAAIVAGYDVTVRISEAANPGALYDRGFHPTAVTGTFGATAAAANVAEADASAIENAFGINASQAAGTLQFLENGAWNKRIHTGLTAHNAILAYRFAAAGAIGALDPLEGRYGFFRGYTDGARPELALRSLGKSFAIDETAFKPYPSCRYSHAALDQILEIVRERGLTLDRVERVRVGLPRAGMNLIGDPEAVKRDARSIVDGQFSMYFLAAVAMLRGSFGWNDYALLGSPEIAQAIGRVDVALDPEIEAMFPTMAASVEIELRDGEKIRRVNLTPKGEPAKPLSWDELIAKFEGLAGAVYDAPRLASIVSTVRGLDALEDVRALTRLLGAPG